MLCVLSILLTYLLVAVAVMMYAGIGDTGLGLGNKDNAANVFGALAYPVLGDWGGPLLLLAVFVLPTAFLMHGFWGETDPAQKANEQIHFHKDLSLGGAALALFGLFAAFGDQIGLMATNPLF